MTDRRPLEGIRVIDFTTLVAGPWCTRLLADCGAEVIKIETVGDGDVMRYAQPAVNGVSRSYAHFNCGKRSISIDLKSPAGLDVARRLIERADVVIENFRPGVMRRLSLDYDNVKKIHPKLVYCSVSGFGQTGAMAGQAAYAPIVHALSSLDHAFMTAQGDGGVPPASSVMMADVVAAVYAFGAIQTALMHRERNGVGTHIDATLIEATMSLVAFQFLLAQTPEAKPLTVFRPIRTRDGYVVSPLVTARNYATMYEVMGRTDWLGDSNYTTLPGIQEHRSEIEAAVAQWACERTTAEIEQTLVAAGIACAPYRSAGETLHDAHLRDRGSFAAMDDGSGYFVLNPPFKLSDTDCTARPWVAERGEHTRDIARTVLALNDGEIDRLYEEHAFG
jgi:CoA:oxalate CoA-transferase